jgi:transposase
MVTLEEFIHQSPNAHELKRALAVQMKQRGHSYREIRDVLQVSLGFITASVQRYATEGVSGFKLKYWGTQGYLSREQKQELMEWLLQKKTWVLEEVIEHLEVTYHVVFQSQQSYYDLLKQAGFSWKQSHITHPNRDAQQVEEKKMTLPGYWYSGGRK